MIRSTTKLCLWATATLVFTLSCMTVRSSIGRLVVAKDGSGDFRTIQEAINSLPDSASAQRTIYIKKGEYREKIFISKHQLKLEGENPENTIITYPVAREVWRCEHPVDDWGAAVMNLSGNDITLKGLSVINSYGFANPKDTTLSCAGTDGTASSKVVTKNSHQFALRSFQSTRLQAVNCIFRSYAGDTVSPWNDTTGMYYFKDCIMEGGVDFYCPRGWAYAENIKFICRQGSAAIWHDGSRDVKAKSIIKNSVFTGFEGFKLGRYHRDAQIYLIGNTFSETMANVPVYQAESSPGVQWGHRVYFYGNTRRGDQFSWFADNLASAPGSPDAKDITVKWAFDGRWYPSEAR